MVNSSEINGLKKIPFSLVSLDSECMISGDISLGHVVEERYRASLMDKPPSLKW